MIVWVFGTSSDFGQVMLSEFEKHATEVHAFGRSNLDYKDPKSFIDSKASELEIPDTVVFNINVGTPFEMSRPIHIQNQNTQKLIFREWFDNSLDTNFFKVYLFDWLINNGFKGQICHITSQVARDQYPDLKDLLQYKMLRALDYQIIQTQRQYGIDSYGMCPAQLEDITKWAKYMSNLILDKNKEKTWLYGIVKDSNTMTYMTYPSDGLYD
jgi:hypothetical protein